MNGVGMNDMGSAKSLHARRTRQQKAKYAFAVVLAAIIIVAIYLHGSVGVKGQILNANNIPYLTQNQLSSIFGTGEYVMVNTGSYARTVNGNFINSLLLASIQSIPNNQVNEPVVIWDSNAHVWRMFFGNDIAEGEQTAVSNTLNGPWTVQGGPFLGGYGIAELYPLVNGTNYPIKIDGQYWGYARGGGTTIYVDNAQSLSGPWHQYSAIETGCNNCLIHPFALYHSGTIYLYWQNLSWGGTEYATSTGNSPTSGFTNRGRLFGTGPASSNGIWDKGSYECGQIVQLVNGTYVALCWGGPNAPDTTPAADGFSTSNSPSGPFTAWSGNPWPYNGISNISVMGANDFRAQHLVWNPDTGYWNIFYNYGSYGNSPSAEEIYWDYGPTTSSTSNSPLGYYTYGGQAINISLPSILSFAINTSTYNVTVPNSYAIGFSVKEGQSDLLLVGEVISSPDASYLFSSQAPIATYSGNTDNLQYYLVNGTEVIANRGNYFMVFKCAGNLCSSRNINETISALSRTN
jgi:hypothetical protein